MEHFELVEKLVNTFGVSFEAAKNALEASGWDPVEAAVILEREKNGTAAAEEPKVNTNPKGTFETVGNEWKEEGTKFFKNCWDFLSLNEVVVKKSSGEVFLDIPIWLAALLLCAFFWAVILVMGILFVMGYRFSFSGPHLGKRSAKNAVENVEKAAEDVVEKVTNAVQQEPEVVVPEPEAEEQEAVCEPEVKEPADEGSADPADNSGISE